MTDKEVPLSEWPLPGFAHPGSNPEKNYIMLRMNFKKARLDVCLLKTYDREEDKFLKEVLGIIPIEVPKVSYG